MGTGGTEAIVEELGDEVMVRRVVPEGVNEGGAGIWLSPRGNVKAWRRGWNIRC